MAIEIILAEQEDVQAVLKITNEEATRSLATAAYGDEPLSRWQEAWASEHERYPWLIAVERGRLGERHILGYAKASPFNPRDGFMWSVNLSIYLRPEAQGQGLSVKLYERLFALIRAQGYRSVYARVALPNPASVYLHERFGLERTGLLPHFSWKNEHWYDLAIFTGKLSPSTAPPAPILKVSEAWRLLS